MQMMHAIRGAGQTGILQIDWRLRAIPSGSPAVAGLSFSLRSIMQIMHRRRATSGTKVLIPAGAGRSWILGIRNAGPQRQGVRARRSDGHLAKARNWGVGEFRKNHLDREVYRKTGGVSWDEGLTLAKWGILLGQQRENGGRVEKSGGIFKDLRRREQGARWRLAQGAATFLSPSTKARSANPSCDQPCTPMVVPHDGATAGTVHLAWRCALS
jgi:hypothetical protein